MQTQSFTLEDISLIECYREIENSINTSVTIQPDGTSIIQIDDHWTYYHMPTIDQFVRQVLATTTPAFTLEVNALGRTSYHQQELATKYFRTISGTIGVGLHERLDVRNVFVDLFIASCNALKIHSWRIHVMTRPGRIANANAESFNELVDIIRAKAKEPAYRSRIRHSKDDPIRNFEECEKYVHALFAKYSRYTVMRIDLCYKSEAGFNVFTQDAKADLNRFLRNRRNNRRLFAKMAGYIWKIEYGTGALLHYHLILFFRNMSENTAGYWAGEIGKYWVNVITKGRGRFENCLYSKHKYAKRGIGVINRKETDKIENLIGAIGYLFKEEQCLPIRRNDPQLRTFGKSEIATH